VFNVVNVLYFGIEDIDSYIVPMLYVSICYFLFLVAIKSRPIKIIQNNNKLKLGEPNKLETFYLFGVVMFFQIISVFFQFKNVGFGLIKGEIDPNIKVTMTQNGFGIFKYIAIIGRFYFLPIIFHAFFVHRIKFILYFGLFWFICTSFIFNTSKAGFLFILFDIGILLFFMKKHFGFKFNYTKIITIGILGLIPAFMTISFFAQNQKSIEIVVLERFVDTGGGTYAYFIEHGERGFDDFSFLRRLRYYFDTLLSVFRFKPWEDPSYMSIVKIETIGDYIPGFGQNPYIFLNGHFLFKWGGVFYCFILGLCINFIRNSKLNIIWFFVLNKLFFDLIKDPDMAQADIIAILFIAPFFVLMKIFSSMKNKVTINN
jgi:hypothetical protein